MWPKNLIGHARYASIRKTSGITVIFTDTLSVSNTTLIEGKMCALDFDLQSLKELPDELYRTWEAYDVDEEAALWIGSDGHGKNGAPYRISDILKDMEEVDERLKMLWEEIYKLW